MYFIKWRKPWLHNRKKEYWKIKLGLIKTINLNNTKAKRKKKKESTIETMPNDQGVYPDKWKWFNTRKVDNIS